MAELIHTRNREGEPMPLAHHGIYIWFWLGEDHVSQNWRVYHEVGSFNALIAFRQFWWTFR